MTGPDCLVFSCERAACARLVIQDLWIPVCVPHALNNLYLRREVGVVSMRAALPW